MGQWGLVFNKGFAFRCVFLHYSWPNVLETVFVCLCRTVKVDSPLRCGCMVDVEEIFHEGLRHWGSSTALTSQKGLEVSEKQIDYSAR